MSRHHARGTKKRYSLRALEITAELGTDLMQIVCGRGYYNKPAEKAWKRSAESLDVILRRAQELGVRLTVEGLLPFESNVVNSLSSASRMIEELNAPNFGCMIDTVPMSIADNNLDELASNRYEGYIGLEIYNPVYKTAPDLALERSLDVIRASIAV